MNANNTIDGNNNEYNLIDLEKIILARQLQADEESSDMAATGAAILKNLSQHEQKAVMAFFAAWLRAELSVSLGLIDDDGAFAETPLYDIVAEIYRDAAGKCYFCDHEIDPNEIEINAKTHICPMCSLKLANFVTALGIDPSKLMRGIFGPRTVQETRIKPKK